MPVVEPEPDVELDRREVLLEADIFHNQQNCEDGQHELNLDINTNRITMTTTTRRTSGSDSKNLPGQFKTLLKRYLESLPDCDENRKLLTYLALKTNSSTGMSLLAFRRMLIKSPSA
jgi:hypothetical protein